MTEPVPPWLAALMQPARYPHPVERVELLQTHGAWVLLAGAFAYKIKKPVRFPFLDFSTLAARRGACETELRVNRRFQQHDQPTTQLYLGVLPIVGTPDDPRWGVAGTDDDRQAFEFAVQMRRFDQVARLDQVCRRGALIADHLTGLARRMARFQARAAVAEAQVPGPAAGRSAGSSGGYSASASASTLAGMSAGTSAGTSAGSSASWSAGSSAGSAAGSAANPSAGSAANPSSGNLSGKAPGRTPGPSPGQGGQGWGHPAAAMRWPRDNFNSLRTLLTEPADAARVRALSDWTEQRFVAIEPLLSRRRQKGRVREGHGDLHLANLVLIGAGSDQPAVPDAHDVHDVPGVPGVHDMRNAPEAPGVPDRPVVTAGGEVLPFDAIEFNDELRWIDVASDISFTWMDLLDHGQPGLANVWLSEWLDASGDVSAPSVWTFFASYRALVRAKVAALRAVQLDDASASAEADAARAEARRYLALAQAIARPPAPRLLITHGLSGSGKSWASGRWLQAEASGRAIRLRSDVERKRLHGVSPLSASGSALNSGLYRPQAHEETYRSLRDRARGLLQDGWTVLVDAAFLRAAERQAFAELAQGLGCPFHILACEAPLDELRRRIVARQTTGGDASEATLAVLEQQLGWLEPLTPAERACAWRSG